MFDSAVMDEWADLAVHPVAALASLAEANQVELKQRENRVLRIAAAWADAFPGDPRVTSPLLERGQQLGGDGTPLVSEFSATELAPLLGKSHGGARAWTRPTIPNPNRPRRPPRSRARPPARTCPTTSIRSMLPTGSG